MPKTILIILVLLLAGCGQKKHSLNVFTFTDYIDPKVVEDFERQFDCKVTLDFFGSGDAVMAKLSTGGVAVYDVVCLGDGEVPLFSHLGLLAPLRTENLPNLKNVDTNFVQRSSDPNHQYSIPYAWSFMGIFARKPSNGSLDETWGLLFDPQKQRGSFMLFDDSRACIAAALCYKGYSVNTTNRNELIEARELLVDAKRRSLGFEVPLALRNGVRSGKSSMAMAMAGVDAQGAIDSEAYFFVPREGSYIGLDRLAIPAKAPHRDLAEAFLNFLLDASVGAQNAKTLGMATPNRAAKALLPAAMQNDSQLYPSAEVMLRLQFIQDVGEHTKLYDELWTQIKAK